MAITSKPLGTFRILWEALKLFTNNWVLMAPITLITLLSYSLLLLSNYYSIYPLLMDLFVKLYTMHSTVPNTSEHRNLVDAAREGLTHLTIIEATFITISFILSSFLLVTTVSAVAGDYLHHHLTLKELTTRVKRSWKGPVITQLYVNVLALGCMVLLSALSVCFVLVSGGGSATLVVFGVGIAIPALYFYLSLASVWSLGVVVSVLEDGCWGIRAVIRATELIKGRRSQGMVITLLMMMATVAVSGAHTFSTAMVPRLTGSPLANGFVMVNVSGLLHVVILSAYTVFYYECKKSKGEEEMVPMRDEFSYITVPTAHVDAGLAVERSYIFP